MKKKQIITNKSRENNKLRKQRAGNSKRTDSKTKELEQRPGAKVINKPNIREDIGPPPKHFSKKERKLWDRFIWETGWLTDSSDRAVLEQACHLFAEWQECAAYIRKHGPYLEDLEDGSPIRESIIAKRERYTRNECLKCFDKLGMTPTSINKVQVHGKPKTEGLDKLLQ